MKNATNTGNPTKTKSHTPKSRTGKTLIVFCLLLAAFLVLFCVRLAGLMLAKTGDGWVVYNEYFNTTRNIVNVGSPLSSAAPAQHYETTAALAAYSTSFEQDEASLRSAFKDTGAVVQTELASGLAGARTLRIAAGVTPESFDTLVALLQGVGETRSVSVAKQDRSEEYSQLTADYALLLDTHDAYNGLKGMAQTLNEHIMLEERLLDITQQIYMSEGTLGEFAPDEGFCTVEFTLSEQAGELTEGESFGTRLAAAAPMVLVWAVRVYAVVLAFVAVLAALAAGLVFLQEKLYRPK